MLHAIEVRAVFPRDCSFMAGEVPARAEYLIVAAAAFTVDSKS